VHLLPVLVLLLAACEPAADVDDFVPPDPPDHGIQVHLPALEIASGEELERCRLLKADHDVDGFVTRMELFARTGLHHAILSVAESPAEDDEVECFGIPFELMTTLGLPTPMFASRTQTEHEVTQLPDGVGIPLAAGAQLVLDYHYLNLTDEDVSAEVFINLHFAEEEDDIAPAGIFNLGRVLGIDVPAGGEQSLTTSCGMPADRSLVSVGSHMHGLGRGFAIWRRPGDGGPAETLYESDRWENPEVTVFDPPLPLGPDDELTFTCEWSNPGSEGVSFGPDSESEMCTVFGYLTPATDPFFAYDVTNRCDDDEPPEEVR
jgi:hypothetical protein